MTSWYFIASETGHALDVSGAGINPGTPTILYPIKQDASLNQLWKIDGQYIVSKQTGFVLSLSTCPINGPNLVVKPKDLNDKGQLWKYDSNNFTLDSALPFYVLTVLDPAIVNPKSLGLKHIETPVPKTQRFIFVESIQMQ
ncbi:635_t:CDS:2 [Ambispora gerdemannii]|uniref:635_t:CDS:1 n=1 Tax=Ambispora gerdemannii TaxID=144530 RepID=A0A9N8ZKV9_9GLOM|nr:635_t:CDS:2 [Ambispora gerdemannii]